MRLNIITIVLDGMPFIAQHLPIFNRLCIDWHWYVIEGAAMNTHCTAWCKPQEPRLSRDGTTAYLHTLLKHPRVSVCGKQRWDGKVEMFNEALKHFPLEECVLLEVDVDEFWTAPQLDTIAAMFETDSALGAMQFYCRYFVGQNIVITSDNTYGNHHGEWLRAWRWKPGFRFLKHEPPVLDPIGGLTMPREETRFRGLVFDHHAYTLPQQVAFKETFYGYSHATEHWRRLQENRQWPVKLSKFLPWVTDEAVADLLHK